MATRELAAPANQQAAADLVARCGNERLTVRVRGRGTKWDWGTPCPPPDVELDTDLLNNLLEHNEGDLTTIVEPGVRLDDAQRRYAERGQMLALDPPTLGEATIGGVLATGDSGPLRHRYGAPRDLVLGMTVALSDGTVAKSGGRVIKNVAGYDIGKLFCGSFGTLGLILQVALRLHPLPPETVTVVARTEDPEALARAASDLTHASLEKECVDVRWENGSGAVLVQLAGATAQAQAEAAAELVRDLEPELHEKDGDLWEQQRAGQRSADQAVVRVSGLQTELARVVRTTQDAGGALVGRAALGLSWVRLPADRVQTLRNSLVPFPCVVLDAPPDLRSSLDVWDAGDGLDIARRIKQRFDPTGTFAPGTFAGGI
jgi:glycolate dehydrogenase FAD-binding subunit